MKLVSKGSMTKIYGIHNIELYIKKAYYESNKIYILSYENIEENEFFSWIKDAEIKKIDDIELIYEKDKDEYILKLKDKFNFKQEYSSRYATGMESFKLSFNGNIYEIDLKNEDNKMILDTRFRFPYTEIAYKYLNYKNDQFFQKYEGEESISIIFTKDDKALLYIDEYSNYELRINHKIIEETDKELDIFPGK